MAEQRSVFLNGPMTPPPPRKGSVESNQTSITNPQWNPPGPTTVPS